MTLGKRKKFWACFLAVECVFTVCASGYTPNTSIFYYFVFGPNKRTNKQTMPDLRLALSSLQCPVQLPPSTRDQIEDSTWSTQCKPKQGSFSIATQSLILHWRLWKGSSRAIENFSRKLPIPFHAGLSLTLKSLSEGVVRPRTKLLRHFQFRAGQQSPLL